MKKIFPILLTSLILSGCANMAENMPENILPKEMPEAITKTRVNELVEMKAPNGPPIVVAVYNFGDKTGQRKPVPNVATLSSAVTQGAETFLIKALQDAGHGKWFKVAERVGLDDLIKERQLIRNQRETYEGNEAKPLAPLMISGVMIQGGIVGYDTNLGSGGIGAALLGIGLSHQYRVDEITVLIRLVSVHTGEVLVSAGATKTILSAGMNGNLVKFLDQGTMSVQMETGLNINETSTYSVRLATEAAVVDMIKQGAAKGLWSFAKEGEKAEQPKPVTKPATPPTPPLPPQRPKTNEKK